MSSIRKILNHAEQSCSAHGARLTEKRKWILTGLLKSKLPLSAYELVDFCREEFNESLPPMSVYRILDFLEKENLVHKLHLANKFMACSHISCDHAHEVPQFLICGECGIVEEIGIQKSIIASLKKNVEQANFQLRSPQLELHCVCQSCSNHVA